MHCEGRHDRVVQLLISESHSSMGPQINTGACLLQNSSRLFVFSPDPAAARQPWPKLKRINPAGTLEIPNIGGVSGGPSRFGNPVDRLLVKGAPPAPPSRLPNRSSAARRGKTAGIRKKEKRPIAGLKVSAISPGRLSDDSCSAEPMLSQLGAVMIDELPPAVAAPAPQLGVGRHHPLRRHHGQDAFPHAAAPIVDSPIFSLCPRWVLCEVFPAPPGSRVTFCIPRRN